MCRFIIAAIAVALIAGCSTHEMQAPPTLHSDVAIPGLAQSPLPQIYLSNFGDSDILTFPENGSGDIAPLRAIFGQDLSGVYGMAADSSGRAYVTTISPNVLIFGANADNMAPPKFVITCGGLGGVQGLAVNRDGLIFVANNGQATISIFQPLSNGCVTGNAQIAGPDTRLSNPTSVAIGRDGKIVVACGSTPGCIVEFAKGSTGDATPIAVIAGRHTHLNGEVGIAVDSSGQVYVTDFMTRSIDVFRATANGDVSPVRRIRGPSTGLDHPAGIAVSASGEIYVTEELEDAINVYPAGANGDVAPIRTIAGSLTLIRQPEYIALFEPR